MSMKILITGLSGFIGGFIVEEALSRGYENLGGCTQNDFPRTSFRPRNPALSTSITVTKKFLPTNYYHKGEYGGMGHRL